MQLTYFCWRAMSGNRNYFIFEWKISREESNARSNAIKSIVKRPIKLRQCVDFQYQFRFIQYLMTNVLIIDHIYTNHVQTNNFGVALEMELFD